MAIHTQESLSGFIASEPLLTETAKGDARFFARIGNYVSSAAKQEKHNRLSQFFIDNPHINRQHFFEMCIAPEPSYPSYEALKQDMGPAIEEMVLMAFTKLMVKPRIDIGRALLPANQ